MPSSKSFLRRNSLDRQAERFEELVDRVLAGEEVPKAEIKKQDNTEKTIDNMLDSEFYKNKVRSRKLKELNKLGCDVGAYKYFLLWRVGADVFKLSTLAPYRRYLEESEAVAEKLDKETSSYSAYRKGYIKGLITSSSLKIGFLLYLIALSQI